LCLIVVVVVVVVVVIMVGGEGGGRDREKGIYRYECVEKDGSILWVDGDGPHYHYHYYHSLVLGLYCP